MNTYPPIPIDPTAINNNPSPLPPFSWLPGGAPPVRIDPWNIQPIRRDAQPSPWTGFRFNPLNNRPIRPLPPTPAGGGLPPFSWLFGGGSSPANQIDASGQGGAFNPPPPIAGVGDGVGAGAGIKAFPSFPTDTPQTPQFLGPPIQISPTDALSGSGLVVRGGPVPPVPDNPPPNTGPGSLMQQKFGVGPPIGGI